MKETRNGERAAGKAPDERHGWRRDEFARHEVYTQMLWLWPWVIVLAIVLGILILQSCNGEGHAAIRPSQDEIHACQIPPHDLFLPRVSRFLLGHPG